MMTGEGQIPPKSQWKRLVHAYAWPVAKNALGWLLIVMSLVLGPVVPGPGGIPLFLIGFAMISFPGKRRFTARVLRGRRIGRPPRVYYLVCLAISLILPSIATFFLTLDSQLRLWLSTAVSDPRVVVLCAYFALVAVCWTALRMLPAVLNLCLRWVPKIRRKIRPWMRRHGLHLLPPRHRDRHAPFDSGHRPRDEIMEFTERFFSQFRQFWSRIRLWLLCLAGTGLIGLAAWVTLRHG